MRQPCVRFVPTRTIIVIATLSLLFAGVFGGSVLPGSASAASKRAPRLMTDDNLKRPGRPSCEALHLITVGLGMCSHGPDPAPPGVNPAIPAAPLPQSDVSTQAISCVGNGTDGSRVQVIYARASDVPDQYATYAASIATWSADADQVYRDSSAKTGGLRYIRFVHDSACNIVVANEMLSTSGDDSYGNVLNELTARGYNLNSRKYLVFLDSQNGCGLGTLYGDDHPSPAWNASNKNYTYALVYKGCWSDGMTAAHELGHNLGAVQNSAPNSSLGGHCIDDYDVMCYQDAPYYPTMRLDCSTTTDERLLDCNNNDYFSSNVSRSSYLWNHWNVASSSWLDGNPVVKATAAVPANDAIANAIDLSTVALNSPKNSVIDQAGASTVQQDPVQTCYEGGTLYQFPVSSTVWYKVVAPVSGKYQVTAFPTDINVNYNNTIATVYTGPQNSLNFVGCTFNRNVNPKLNYSIDLTAGTTYWIMVGSYVSSANPGYYLPGTLSFTLKLNSVTTSPTPTRTPTSTATSSPSPTSTSTSTATATPSSTPDPNVTPAQTNTPAPTNTATPSNTSVPTNTAGPTNTAVPTSTPTATRTATAAATQTPTRTPTQSSTPTPVPVVASANPSSGPSGSTTTVSASNLAPGESVTIYWDKMGGTVLATVTADANGKVSASVTIPARQKKGSHSIIVRGAATQKQGSAAYSVI